MKLLNLLLIALSFTLAVKAQEKKDLVISVSTGLLNSPVYEKASVRAFYKIDFDYYLTSRHIISTNYLAGKHYYYDDVLSNAPNYYSFLNGTNSIADYRTFSVMYKYKVISNDIFNIVPDIVPGVGAGVLTHSREYPYEEVSASYLRISSWSDLIFPVSLDINYKVSGCWQFGLTGGFLIHPDYPILALHTGPKLSFVLP